MTPRVKRQGGYVVPPPVSERRKLVDTPEPFPIEELSSVLRRLREGQGLRQRDLDFLTGISSPFISNVERGDRDPSITTIITLFAALGYSIHIKLVPTDDIRQ